LDVYYVQNWSILFDIQKELGNIPNQEYEIVYLYDTQSLLKYYGKIFTMPALERLTGINQKQLHHYIMGKSTPREQTKNKQFCWRFVYNRLSKCSRVNVEERKNDSLRRITKFSNKNEKSKTKEACNPSRSKVQ